MLRVYGLKNCDPCRKARQWLADQAIEHLFFDLRGPEGLDNETIARLLDAIGADNLVNRRGTTWRKLSEDQRGKTGSALVALLAAEPALMKRPIFIDPAGGFVGFDAAAKARLAG